MAQCKIFTTFFFNKLMQLAFHFVHHDRIVWSFITEGTAVYLTSHCITTVCIPLLVTFCCSCILLTDADMHIIHIHIPMYYTCCIIYYRKNSHVLNFTLYNYSLHFVLLVTFCCSCILFRCRRAHCTCSHSNVFYMLYLL